MTWVASTVLLGADGAVAVSAVDAELSASCAASRSGADGSRVSSGTVVPPTGSSSGSDVPGTVGSELSSSAEDSADDDESAVPTSIDCVSEESVANDSDDDVESVEAVDSGESVESWAADLSDGERVLADAPELPEDESEALDVDSDRVTSAAAVAQPTPVMSTDPMPRATARPPTLPIPAAALMRPVRLSGWS